MFFLGFSCHEKFVQERLVGFYVFRALALTPDGTTRERGKGERGKRPRETEREKGEREKAQGKQWCGERESETAENGKRSWKRTGSDGSWAINRTRGRDI